MSKNRKRSTTRPLSSYINEGVTDNFLYRNKLRPNVITRKKYTFGLPNELTRSPVHGFYSQVKNTYTV